MGVNDGGDETNYPRFSKNTAQNSPIHTTSSEKFIFFWLSTYPTSQLLPRMIKLPALNHAFWIRLCALPEFQPILTPMSVAPPFWPICT